MKDLVARPVRPGDLVVVAVPEGFPAWMLQDTVRAMRGRLPRDVAMTFLPAGLGVEVRRPPEGDRTPAHFELPEVEWRAINSD